MRARHALGRRGLVCASIVLAGLLAGCGEAPKGDGAASTNDPKGSARRKEMENFMKNQPPGGTSKP